MKKLFPLLLITILFSQDKEVIVERHSNGVKKSIIVYEGEGSNEKLIGKLGFYKNGKLQFSTDWKDGMRNGNVIVNYENGELGFKGKYLNDRLDGEMIYYYPNDDYKPPPSRFQYVQEIYGNRHLFSIIKFTKVKSTVIGNGRELDRNEMMEKGYEDSSNVYLMSYIRIFDKNGKRYENLLENKMFDEYDEFIYENQIVDVLYTLRKFDYKFFRGGLNK